MTTCVKNDVWPEAICCILLYTTCLRGKRKNNPTQSMKNVEGEGNRKDVEGHKGELLHDGRGGTSGEDKR